MMSYLTYLYFLNVAFVLLLSYGRVIGVRSNLSNTHLHVISLRQTRV